MKVLILSNKVPYPANDGSSIAIASMVDGLMKNGATVRLMSINTRKHFRRPDLISDHLPEGLVFESVYSNTSINPIGAFINLISGKAYHVSRFYVRAFAERLEEVLKNETFDLVQIEGLAMGVYLPLIRQYSSAKLVLRAHNVEHQIWDGHLENENNNWKKSYLNIQNQRLQRFEEFVCKEVDAIVAITEEDKAFLNQLSADVPMFSLPCGIDIDHFPVPNVQKEFDTDIVYLASFDWMPNVQGLQWFVQEVWPLLTQSNPNISFSLGGRHMPKSFDEYSNLGIALQPDVPDMKQFISKGKVVIVPLLAGSGMRIKVIENMALGKCQISTGIGAEGIQVQNGHDILIADTAQDFADSILRALNNEGLRNTIENNARKTIEEHYSNRKLGGQLLNFYKALN